MKVFNLCNNILLCIFLLWNVKIWSFIIFYDINMLWLLEIIGICFIRDNLVMYNFWLFRFVLLIKY